MTLEYLIYDYRVPVAISGGSGLMIGFVYIYFGIAARYTRLEKKIRKTGAKNPLVGEKLGAEITQFSFESLFVSNNVPSKNLIFPFREAVP